MWTNVNILFVRTVVGFSLTQIGGNNGVVSVLVFDLALGERD